MPELTPRQRRRLERLAKQVEDKDLARLEHLADIEEKVEDTSEAVSILGGELAAVRDELKKKLDTEFDLQIDPETIRGPRGEDGEDGADADEEEIIDRLGAVLLAKVPTPQEVAAFVPNLKGDPGEPGKSGEPGKPGADGSPDTPLEVAGKLNTTRESVEPYVIRGLDEIGRLARIGASNVSVPSVSHTALQKVADRVTTLEGAGGGGTVKVSSNDTTGGYLNGKLVAGSNITLTENNDGGNETLTISGSATYTDEQAQDAVGGMVNSTLTYVDGTPSLGINLSNANTWAADQSVPDEAYGAGWNGSLEVPTKNAVYDKIETLGAGAAIGGTLTSGTPGSVVFVGGTDAAPTIAQDNQNFHWHDADDRLSLFTTTGSSLLTNGGFTGNANGWTVGSGWAYASNAVSHTSNGTAALSQAVAIAAMREYLLTYTVSALTVGTVNVTLTMASGSYTGPTRSANGTYTERIQVSSPATALNFVPSSAARLTLDAVSLVPRLGTNTKANLSVGGQTIEGNWANGTPGTTRALTFSNDGSNTWTDYRFGGSLRAAFGANANGGVDLYASGGNYFAFYSGNANFGVSTLTAYLYPIAFVHTTGYGAFAYGVNAGSQAANTSTLQSAGGTALKVKRVTVNQTLDNTATHWLGDASTQSCTGTASVACATYTNQTDCELRDSHGGCTWFAGNPCSTFDYELGMAACAGQAGCTVVTSSCSGAGDQTSCEAQDDAYGGSCSWAATGDCSPFDESTCLSYSGQCTTNNTDCSGYTTTATCEADPGCDATISGDCSALSDGGGDGTNCATQPECSYDSGTGACSGAYFTSCSGAGSFSSCSGSYNACSGTYNTGSCTGTYGAACSGTPLCSVIDDSANCNNETGCSWQTVLNLTLPDGETCPDRTYWVKNDTSGGQDVVILPYSGQTVEKASSLALSNYQDAVHLAYYKQTYDCSNYVTEGACTAHTGCSANYGTCHYDTGSGDCVNDASCSAHNGNQSACEAQTYFNGCTGTEVVAKNWYVF